jgi:glyoxylase-like metal-dependent hydrolase (beta-lactamase superfamily II)
VTPIELGGLRVTPLLAGHMRLDGGAMFGVVPKPLWQRVCPPDERNRIANACRALLVRASEATVLIETGCGDRFDDRTRDIFAVDATATLPAALAAIGVSADEVTHVVLTHLHFDHAAGALAERGGQLEPAFPEATHIVQRGEWEDAIAGRSIMRSSYLPADLAALEDAHWEFTEGDGPVLPSLSVQVTGGHTRHHQAVWLHGDDDALLFPGDVLPSRYHLNPYWIMAYDMFPHDTFTAKQTLMKSVHEEDAILAWDHDPDGPFSRLTVDERGAFVVIPLEA